MKVDIVDIGCGNTRSIESWLRQAHAQPVLVKRPEDLRSEVLVLPGVGAAGFFLNRIRETRFDLAIKAHVKNQKSLIGICLGFQALSNYSAEDGGQTCLGLIDAEVVKMSELHSHNQWQTFEMSVECLNPNYFGQAKLSRKKRIRGRVFYNHEYGFVNRDPSAASIPVASPLDKYSAMLIKDNIIGMQFHPEKSQFTGKDILKMIL